MLVLPGPPKSLPSTPPEKFGEYAMPMRGANVSHLVGETLEGTPGSPGTRRPSGAVGNSFDCWPETMVSTLPCVSVHGWLTSQRRPRFRVRFAFTFQESCAN